jgi:hypothetical protein
MNMFSNLVRCLTHEHKIIHHWLSLVYGRLCIWAAGAVANVVLFFLVVFLFAEAEGDSWIRWYFGDNGIIIVSTTFVLSLVAFPFVKRLRMRLI